MYVVRNKVTIAYNRVQSKFIIRHWFFLNHTYCGRL